jgi:hypothetical protein
MVADATVASGVALLVTASFPFFLYGAWVMIDTEVITWGVLVYHLKFIAVGLTLTTIPMLTWMLPRLFEQLGGFAVVHAFFGVQAYALLVFALTGIYPMLREKLRYDLYHDPDPDLALEDIHEDMPIWRRRLRVGVFGFVLLWLVAWVLGVARFIIRYQVL